MTISIKELSAKELRDLRDRIDTRLPIAEREAADRIRKMAEEAGVDLASLVGKKKARKAPKKAANRAHWRDVNGMTWSGRGRKPKGWTEPASRLV